MVLRRVGRGAKRRKAGQLFDFGCRVGSIAACVTIAALSTEVVRRVVPSTGLPEIVELISQDG